MLNENKVKMMTKMAIFEKNNEKDLICHTKYYKSDYVTYSMIKSLIAATVAFVLVVAMVAVYNLDYIVTNINNLDYSGIGLTLVWSFILFMVAYGAIAFFVYSRRYEKSRPEVKKYYSRLARLERFYGNQKK